MSLSIHCYLVSKKQIIQLGKVGYRTWTNVVISYHFYIAHKIVKFDSSSRELVVVVGGGGGGSSYTIFLQ